VFFDVLNPKKVRTEAVWKLAPVGGKMQRVRPDATGQTPSRTGWQQLADVSANPAEGCGGFRGPKKLGKTVHRR